MTSDRPSSAGPPGGAKAPSARPAVSAPLYRVHAVDVVFRLAAGCFAVWVVAAAAIPTAVTRPPWWPAFVVLGGLVAVAIVATGFTTLHLYLRQREIRPPHR